MAVSAYLRRPMVAVPCMVAGRKIGSSSGWWQRSVVRPVSADTKSCVVRSHRCRTNEKDSSPPDQVTPVERKYQLYSFFGSCGYQRRDGKSTPPRSSPTFPPKSSSRSSSLPADPWSLPARTGPPNGCVTTGPMTPLRPRAALCARLRDYCVTRRRWSRPR